MRHRRRNSEQENVAEKTVVVKNEIFEVFQFICEGLPITRAAEEGAGYEQLFTVDQTKSLETRDVSNDRQKISGRQLEKLSFV